jgi:indolepyruvate decarboxylase
MAMISAAKRPIVMAGVEVHRFGLQDLFLKFIQCSGFPFVSGIMGKSVVSEKHPQFVGIYEGGMSPEDVRQAVEEADCFIAIGPMVTDFATGIFTQHIDRERVIMSEPHKVIIKHHTYAKVGMKDFLEVLTAALPKCAGKIYQPKKHELAPFAPEANKNITIERVIACVNTFLSDETTIIADVGDALFSALDLCVHEGSEFIGTGYYASLGFAVPAALGVQFAAPQRRPLVISGDGSFQMSAMELSVACRYGLSPIVIVLNNGGYGTFRPMVDGAFNDIQPWKYADIVKIIGKGEGYTVTKENELCSALAAAKKNNTSPTIIDVRLEKYDCSQRMKRLTENLKKRVK